MEEPGPPSRSRDGGDRAAAGASRRFHNLLTVISTRSICWPVRRATRPASAASSTAQRATERGAGAQQLLVFARRQPLSRGSRCHGVIRGFEAVLCGACPEPIAFDLGLSPAPLAVEIDAPQFEARALPRPRGRDAGGGRCGIISTRLSLVARRCPASRPAITSRSALPIPGGHAPAVRARAFDRFSRPRRSEGSGLGLSQVYGFVGIGRPACDRQQPGSGTPSPHLLVACPSCGRPSGRRGWCNRGERAACPRRRGQFPGARDGRTLRGMGYDVAPPWCAGRLGDPRPRPDIASCSAIS